MGHGVGGTSSIAGSLLRVDHSSRSFTNRIRIEEDIVLHSGRYTSSVVVTGNGRNFGEC